MKNPRLTEWLQIVWDALAESDEAKRNRMLHVADRLLQRQDNQRPPVLRRQQCVIEAPHETTICPVNLRWRLLRTLLGQAFN